MNITGNFKQLWQNLVAVGNDEDLNRSWRLPSLVFDKVDFSGIKNTHMGRLLSPLNRI